MKSINSFRHVNDTQCLLFKPIIYSWGTKERFWLTLAPENNTAKLYMIAFIARKRILCLFLNMFKSVIAKRIQIDTSLMFSHKNVQKDIF